jgi:hypothetical protein
MGPAVVSSLLLNLEYLSADKECVCVLLSQYGRDEVIFMEERARKLRKGVL